MAVITSVPHPNIWNEICKETERMRPPFKDDDELSVATVLEDYNATKHSPVFYGDVMHKRISVDQLETDNFDPSVSHPACVGYALIERPPPPTTHVHCSKPNKMNCTPREYLEHYVFPTLLPALEELLRQAKIAKCFERKRTRFNAADYITEYLYRNNPMHCDRQYISLDEIPFVREWWMIHPRPALPNSVLWSEAEAALIIQSYWQGYKVRVAPEVQELRQWQREWNEENRQTLSSSVNVAILCPPITTNVTVGEVGSTSDGKQVDLACSTDERQSSSHVEDDSDLGPASETAPLTSARSPSPMANADQQLPC